ncbi:serine hydrolase domain-containing protein [Pseudorhodoferax sp.]|uniref:serine hydrolase domain-containing protein n=1 Tax=Pseudorhodoferax sp. TaxID=1993553 RepID=UPI002DD68DB4|nr:serine hydrolase [Pseudorhodoferax sp.]
MQHTPHPGRRRLLAAALAWPVGLYGPGPAAAQEPAAAAPAGPAATWPDVDASGWSRDGLRAVDELARGLGSSALLVVHRGRPVHAWGAIDQPLPVYSVRKSVLGVLIGMAQARGEIRLDTTLATLDINDREGLSAQERQATVQHLLQSRSGVYHRAAYETADMARERPARASHAPGTHWYYNNWDFNALGTIFRRSTGVDAFQALERDLALPLQFQDFDRSRHTRWHHEQASEHGAYLMDLSARDLARVGLLMARDGHWAGRPLVPAGWVAQSVQPWSIVEPGWQAYGYLWWVPQKAWPFWSRQPGNFFFASGNHGQFVWVDRASDLVVVHRAQARWWRNPIVGVQLSPVLQHLLQAMPATAPA